MLDLKDARPLGNKLETSLILSFTWLHHIFYNFETLVGDSQIKISSRCSISLFLFFHQERFILNGIAYIYGLKEIQAGKMVEFASDVNNYP